MEIFINGGDWMEEFRYPERWEINSIFDASSDSTVIHNHLKEINQEVTKLEVLIGNMEYFEGGGYSVHLKKTIQIVEKTKADLSQLSSFLTCRSAENTQDQQVFGWKGKFYKLSVKFNSLVRKVQKWVANLNDESWNEISRNEDLKHYQFILKEWRRQEQKGLPEREEKTIELLLEDGYHAWGDLYKSLVAEIRLKINMNGTSEELSIAQTRNLRSHPKEDLRRDSYFTLNNTWKNNSTTISTIINRIAGVRRTINDLRGESELHKSLRNNRIKERTLDAMWNVVNQNKQPFVRYLNQKSKLLGNNSMRAYDFWAPVNKEVQSINYQDGIEFILNHFRTHSPELEEFSRKAIQQNWVEVEDRANKAGYAFCAGFPSSGESRIFMTYGGRITDTLTLAHELGHAFHNHAMRDVNYLNRDYPMTLAETASTYSEMIVLNAALKEAESQAQKLFLIDEKLKRSVMNFMEIHSRFLFEKNLYKERQHGYVTVGQLNKMMRESLEEGYQGSMDDLSEYSWASTPHFYLTKSPFYNFPYTFGYLLAMGIYEKVEQEGSDFETKYISLLRDSGRMNVEDLVMKHLGEDITKEDFWEIGMRRCVQDVEEYIKVSEQLFSHP